jgi:predicted permease
MHTLTQDIRYALRQLRSAPGFTLTAVLTLALGIGATTAIFTLVYQVMLRNIPVEHPEQLYKLGKENECCVTGGVPDQWNLFNYDLYRDLRDRTPGIDGMAAVQAGATTASVRQQNKPADAQPLNIRFVSGNYFPLLGVTPYAGRMITPADDNPGAPPVVVISYALWQAKFAADPTLVGSTLLFTGKPATVIGIASRNFLGERNEADSAGIWMPLSQEPVFEPERKLLLFSASNWLDLLVRVKDPSAVPHLQATLQGELRQWIAAHRDTFPNGITDKQIPQQTTQLVSAAGGINTLRDNYADSLKLLQFVAAFVLLIACANLANLMLVRGMARRQQLSIRAALGAPRLRLVRQMLVEAILLALAGGVAALLVAYAGTHAIIALALGDTTSNPLNASPSLPVLGFALALSLLTGILFGTAPAWIASRANPVEALRGANRSTRDTSALPQRLLVIFQAALSLALLSTAGLLITSLRQLEHQDFHFSPEHRLIVSTKLAAAGYSAPRLANLYRQLDQQFAQLPGVLHFAYATYGPMVDDNWGTDIFRPGDDAQTSNNASYTAVSADYFATIGTKILRGRSINPDDTATSVHVAVVNQLFADKFLQGKQPLGAHFGPDPTLTSEFEVVGIADNTKYGDPNSEVRPMYFTPITQSTAYAKPRAISNEEAIHFANDLIVDYAGDQSAMAAAIRRTLKSINPDIPILELKSYDAQLSSQFTQEDLVVRLTTLFGILALVLAALGLYGVTAHNVQRRTGEIGIRMALGATRQGVLGMIVRGALVQCLIGLAIGIPLSIAAGRLIRSTLYNTPAFEPLVLFAVIALLILATFIAAIIPARRAASIEPIEALRTE